MITCQISSRATISESTPTNLPDSRRKAQKAFLVLRAQLLPKYSLVAKLPAINLERATACLPIF